MLQKTAFFIACLLGLSFFTACETIECFDDQEEMAEPSQMLTDGLWNLEWIEFSMLDDDTWLNWSEDFGPFTDNGECTFEFRDDFECTMIDVEGEVDEEYVVYDDGNLRIGDVMYRLETLTEDVLEIVAIYGDDCEEEEEEFMHFER